MVSVLVIACPSDIGLATPTKIMMELVMAQKKWMLIKND